uniref:T9SS type A sorting domain-containing protein n=1 Tax=Roseihalotalea indica TaxID=2867963 RepID=A0AA49GPX1_9BACT|nr:T9SS type A sorting domain-containing protein [Tunicatimonas sp. TK19036]
MGVPALCQAQDKTANPGAGEWGDPTTWSPVGVPGDGDVILIPSGSEVWVRDDYALDDAVMIVAGELVMHYRSCGFLCFDYGSLSFTGPISGAVMEAGATIIDNTLLGRDALFISANGAKYWTGNSEPNPMTFTEETSFPAGLVNPLPVEMLYFSARYADKAALLAWATASETNNHYFEVERADDNMNFHKIGEVMGAGNSTTQIEYSFRDDKITAINSGVVYYRLRQVDFDGQYEYSKVVAVANKTLDVQKVKVWPNPFQDQLNVLLQSSSPGQVQVALYNTKNEMIFSNVYPVDGSIGELIIDKLQDSPPGIYFLHLTGSSWHTIEKVVKAG